MVLAGTTIGRLTAGASFSVCKIQACTAYENKKICVQAIPYVPALCEIYVLESTPKL